MTSTKVPEHKEKLYLNKIQNGLPVRSIEWDRFADAHNWLIGHGGSLVCGNCIETEIGAGSSHTLTYYSWPRYQAAARIYVLTIQDTSGTSGAYGTFAGNEDGGWTTGWSLDDDSPRMFSHMTDVTQTVTAAAITMTVANDALSRDTVQIRGVGIYDVPRSYLALNNSDDGLSKDSMKYASLIYDKPWKSVDGMNLAAAKATAGRNALYHWTSGTTPISTGSVITTYTDIFQFDPELIGRQLTALQSAIDVQVAMYAEVSAPAGFVKFVSANAADTLVLTVTDTVPTWYTGTLSIESEDLTDAKGWRSATAEMVNMKWAVTATQPYIYIYSICIGEPI